MDGTITREVIITAEVARIGRISKAADTGNTEAPPAVIVTIAPTALQHFDQATVIALAKQTFQHLLNQAPQLANMGLDLDTAIKPP